MQVLEKGYVLEISPLRTVPCSALKQRQGCLQFTKDATNVGRILRAHLSCQFNLSMTFMGKCKSKVDSSYVVSEPLRTGKVQQGGFFFFLVGVAEKGQ